MMKFTKTQLSKIENNLSLKRASDINSELTSPMKVSISNPGIHSALDEWFNKFPRLCRISRAGKTRIAAYSNNETNTKISPAREENLIIQNCLNDWLDIILIDENGYVIGDIDYVITSPNGEKRSGRLDKLGFAREIGLRSAGPFVVNFPELDEYIPSLIVRKAAE